MAVEPDWTLANCIGTDPEAFFPDYRAQVPPLVRRVCAACDIRAECLAYGSEHAEFGIWGGLSASERYTLKRKGWAA
jgi:WhiB family redox-sensing transcriptional regulator